MAAKSGSPLIKVVFAMGTRAIATGFYALGTTTKNVLLIILRIFQKG